MATSVPSLKQVTDELNALTVKTQTALRGFREIIGGQDTEIGNLNDRVDQLLAAIEKTAATQERFSSLLEDVMKDPPPTQ